MRQRAAAFPFPLLGRSASRCTLPSRRSLVALHPPIFHPLLVASRGAATPERTRLVVERAWCRSDPRSRRPRSGRRAHRRSRAPRPPRSGSDLEATSRTSSASSSTMERAADGARRRARRTRRARRRRRRPRGHGRATSLATARPHGAQRRLAHRTRITLVFKMIASERAPSRSPRRATRRDVLAYVARGSRWSSRRASRSSSSRRPVVVAVINVREIDIEKVIRA